MLIWYLKAIAVSCVVASIVTGIVMLIDRMKKPPPEPITDWQGAFNDSRARGHNTDAYTFQIAWAYAQQHFEARAQGDGE